MRDLYTFSKKIAQRLVFVITIIISLCTCIYSRNENTADKCQVFWNFPMVNFSENKMMSEINTIFPKPSNNVMKTFNAYQENVTLI